MITIGGDDPITAHDDYLAGGLFEVLKFLPELPNCCLLIALSKLVTAGLVRRRANGAKLYDELCNL